VTLFADGLSQRRRFEIRGIDDGPVATFVGSRLLFMKLARAVATFASDSKSVKDRRLTALKLNAVRVTEKARWRDATIEVTIANLISRGQVPALFLGVPGNR
jgi:hypothetical protein